MVSQIQTFREPIFKKSANGVETPQRGLQGSPQPGLCLPFQPCLLFMCLMLLYPLPTYKKLYFIPLCHCTCYSFCQEMPFPPSFILSFKTSLIFHLIWNYLWPMLPTDLLGKNKSPLSLLSYTCLQRGNVYISVRLRGWRALGNHMEIIMRLWVVDSHFSLFLHLLSPTLHSLPEGFFFFAFSHQNSLDFLRSTMITWNILGCSIACNTFS